MPGNYETELKALMQQFAPAGGFGIPNVGGLAAQFGRQSDAGYRSSLVQGNQAFDRAGLGRSVGKAFMPGTRKIQFNQDLMDALTKLFSQHGQLAESQRQNLLQMLSPVAQERANRPSWLSSLLGGVLGLGAQVAIPGIGNKLFPNPLMSMFQGQMGGGYPSAYGNGLFGTGQSERLPTGKYGIY